MRFISAHLLAPRYDKVQNRFDPSRETWMVQEVSLVSGSGAFALEGREKRIYNEAEDGSNGNLIRRNVVVMHLSCM